MTPKDDNRKNFFLAMLLMLGVLMAWQFFYARPAMLEAQKQAELQQQMQQQQAAPGEAQTPSPGDATTTLPQPGSTAAVPAPGTAAAPAGTIALPRETALTQSPRVTIDTPTLSGSINLKGARLDDLRLKEYRETVDPTSPTIVLLSPTNAENPYFAEQGWLSPAGTAYRLPSPDTEWSAPARATLTPSTPLTLTWDNGEGLTFSRTFSVDENYMFTVKQAVTNNTGSQVLLFPYARINRQGTPQVAGIYVLFEGLHSVLADSLEELTYANLSDSDPAAYTQKSTGGWLGITDKYWGTALIPDQKMEVNGGLKFVGQPGKDAYQADFAATTPVEIAPGATADTTSRVFAGAKKSIVIDQYQEDLGINKFELMVDWGWFHFITKPLFTVLHWIHGLVGNFGVAILVVTVLLKTLFFPLQNKSYASMSKMKKLAPEMEKIKQRYPDDRAKQQQAIMEMYKKEAVNPLSGCWPILIQIPVFFALYKVIYVTIEMRHAPFVGYLQDLSAPDPTSIFNLFGLLPFSLPYFLMIGFLPILMGITMWIQMRLNPAPPDPIQAQIFNWMPVFFTFLLASFPAGLVLYWTWNNLLSILQQAYIMKKHGVDINLLGNIKSSLGLDKKKGESGK
jgi:YidC/Oxa1 family membrane protein insertase